ncbi:hypothetical protein EYF80_046009 [Liparis tanakae]|uniref:Uncharacterized protein n=1 Tax=Liparis tanakae TaxID=230148 RepID=A0A4Z2FTU2_9TELE|nr:hypothetical protein EYF80_046009 [Liparis tanakae]
MAPRAIRASITARWALCTNHRGEGRDKSTTADTDMLDPDRFTALAGAACCRDHGHHLPAASSRGGAGLSRGSTTNFTRLSSIFMDMIQI